MWAKRNENISQPLVLYFWEKKREKGKKNPEKETKVKDITSSHPKWFLNVFLGEDEMTVKILYDIADAAAGDIAVHIKKFLCRLEAFFSILPSEESVAIVRYVYLLVFL